jgi:hypothetical protein
MNILVTDWFLDLFDQVFRRSKPLVQITSAKPSGGYRLRLQFSNGDEGEIDLFRHIQALPVLAPLAESTVFQQVFVDHGTICWPGDIDLDPIVIHHLTMGLPLDLVHTELAPSPRKLPATHSPMTVRTS